MQFLSISYIFANVGKIQNLYRIRNMHVLFPRIVFYRFMLLSIYMAFKLL